MITPCTPECPALLDPDDPAPDERHELTDAELSGLSGAAGDIVPTDTISLNFAQIIIEYR